MTKKKKDVVEANNSNFNHTNDSRNESNNQTMSFKFSSSSSEIRSFLINDEPWFVAKDVCDILEHTNTSMAILMLDADERCKKSLGRQGNTWIVNESGLYALILRSNKPEAKTFRKWITSEVLPSIRKKGHYFSKQQKSDFIDMRSTAICKRLVNNSPVTTLEHNQQTWVSISDVNFALKNRTDSAQTAKRLNVNQELAVKFWIYGSTRPAWFTNKLGLQLMIMGSRTIGNNQLSLSL